MNNIDEQQGQQVTDVDTDYILAEQVGFLLRRAHQRASLIFKSRFESKSLTPQQFAVLAKLYEVSEVTQNKLGRLVDMDPASLQGVIQRLKQRGFVLRTQDPLHKRRLKMQLTDEGKEMVKSCFDLGRQVSRETLKPLDKTRRYELIRLLKMISDGQS
ncbi:MAG: MarR family winged helix-turn-helix transcriptional regulator [Acidiferrobacterales bacterium]